MNLTEHLAAFNRGDHRPRVVQRPDVHGEMVHVAWTPTREGPPRFDWPAAFADLRDFQEKPT